MQQDHGFADPSRPVKTSTATLCECCLVLYALSWVRMNILPGSRFLSFGRAVWGLVLISQGLVVSTVSGWWYFQRDSWTAKSRAVPQCSVISNKVKLQLCRMHSGLFKCPPTFNLNWNVECSFERCLCQHIRPVRYPGPALRAVCRAICFTLISSLSLSAAHRTQPPWPYIHLSTVLDISVVCQATHVPNANSCLGVTHFLLINADAVMILI